MTIKRGFPFYSLEFYFCVVLTWWTHSLSNSDRVTNEIKRWMVWDRVLSTWRLCCHVLYFADRMVWSIHLPFFFFYLFLFLKQVPLACQHKVVSKVINTFFFFFILRPHLFHQFRKNFQKSLQMQCQVETFASCEFLLSTVWKRK